LVYTLPFMEQDPLWKLVPQPTDAMTNPPINPNLGAAGMARQKPNFANARPPYLRCPSDAWNSDGRMSNYAGSLGPQCAIGGCGYDPFQKYCKPRYSGLGDWGYGTDVGTEQPDGAEWWNHGNSPNASDIRGMFNRAGAKIKLANVLDGTSNTILI